MVSLCLDPAELPTTREVERDPNLLHMNRSRVSSVSAISRSRALRRICDVDATLLHHKFKDKSPSVREASVWLVGSYIFEGQWRRVCVAHRRLL